MSYEVEELCLALQRLGECIRVLWDAVHQTMQAVQRDVQRAWGLPVDPESMSRAERRTAASRRAQRARHHGAAEQRAIAQERRGWSA